MKKNIILFLISFFAVELIFSQNRISSDAESMINSFFDLRMRLGSFEENDTENIILQIENFENENKQNIKDFTIEEQLIIENFIINEKYNYLYQIKGQAKIQHEILGTQLKKLEDYRNLKETEKETTLSEYFYCTMADVMSCFMGYSVGDVLKYGTKVKPLYEKALEINPKFSYALSNIGQWYYYAPAIAGGSKKKALNYFTLSSQNAKTDSQKYFANIFYSQLLFEEKEYEKSSKLLEQILQISPKSKYLQKIKNLNENKKSLYDYLREKSSLDD